MSNLFNIPGFPPPEKQDSVRFHVFKELSYSKRMLLYIFLILIGFLVQILMLRAWPGAVFLLFATILTLVKGYDSRVRMSTFNVDSRWTQVDMDRICQIEELDKKATNWDRDALDISNSIGCFVFILVLIGLLIMLMTFVFNPSLQLIAVIIVVDAAILILPLWFNGIRRILKQNNLGIKVDIIKQMERYFQTTIKKEGENFVPSLLLATDKSGKSVPKDCKFTITYDNMPDTFYGVQAQINLNIVEGISYPYFYCVIATEHGFGLSRYVEQIKKLVPRNIKIEYDEDKNAEVIVIRQHTTKTSGYHTKIPTCKTILYRAVKTGRDIIQSL
jgi:hypothetical protein